MVSQSAVVDCSALVRGFVDDGPSGMAVRSRLSQVQILAAPSLLDYEMLSALFGMRRGGKITLPEVASLITRYRVLGVRRHETLPLWERVQELNHNITAHDAQYVALAEALDLPLITCDARIARSGAAKCAIEVFD